MKPSPGSTPASVFRFGNFSKARLAPVLAFAIYAFISIYFIFPRDARGASARA